MEDRKGRNTVAGQINSEEAGILYKFPESRHLTRKAAKKHRHLLFPESTHYSAISVPYSARQVF